MDSEYAVFKTELECRGVYCPFIVDVVRRSTDFHEKVKSFCSKLCTAILKKIFTVAS